MLDEMNLSKFLSRYYNLTGKDLSKITHEDVKVLFPNIERASFEEIENNPTLISSGKVIIVYDGKKRIPYYAPITIISELDEPMQFIIEKDDSLPRVDNKKHNYAKMSIYELRLLLRRKFSSITNQRKARLELERRGIVLSKKYNRCEEKRKVERIKNEGF